MAQNQIKKFRVIAIGGSAGSLDAVLKIIEGLPGTMRSTIVVVLHRRNTLDSVLPALLAAKTALPVREPDDKEPLLPGHIYVAPPDYHLLVEDEKTFSLDVSEKVQYSRPSIDVSFESVADCFGGNAAAVLLSGANADGAEGLARVKACGGFTIAQDPVEAEVNYMPRQAIERGAADAVLTAEAIAKTVAGSVLI